MNVVCVGGPCHELVVDLPNEQVSFRPTGEARPCYVKRMQSPDKSRAYFALSELTDLEANQLVMEHIRSYRPVGAALRKTVYPPHRT